MSLVTLSDAEKLVCKVTGTPEAALLAFKQSKADGTDRRAEPALDGEPQVELHEIRRWSQSIGDAALRVARECMHASTIRGFCAASPSRVGVYCRDCGKLLSR